MKQKLAVRCGEHRKFDSVIKKVNLDDKVDAQRLSVHGKNMSTLYAVQLCAFLGDWSLGKVKKYQRNMHSHDNPRS